MSDRKKNVKARLKARIKGYEETVAAAGKSAAGYRKPGSLSGRK